ncbi:hypothetical protein B0A55_00690 [Friedmanniomyces simplex]|uniref:Sister chromatid cohesion protein Dcc1 n=1 Tax=Friedmanniomyces simplex TaxID=329884 RepID=A0A4V6WLD1_9PEZI|nr:hypothetical protein B0A55_04550 [Friedmanniomyces simplex]TKA83169.1 hypothetical protein B0A55_00690 [Friedmanniomyces simplex]
MSTQASDGSSFSILPEEQRQPFRLLELSPELLEVVVSDPSARYELEEGSHSVLQAQLIPITRLQFKSGPKIGEVGSTSEEAVLCTPDKTYSVRQVNTSNSVYICQPTSLDDDDDDDGIPQPGLQAIAQSSWTLELSESKSISAAPYLKAALPTYSSTGTYQSKDLVSKQQVFDDIPLCQAECETAWRDLACFELSDPQGCFLPTASAKVQAWRSILDLAVASGVDMTGDIMPKPIDMIIEQNEDWPVELAQAVLASVSNDRGCIDQSKCLVSVGLDLLAMEGARGMPVSDLLKSWRDSLPEKWRAAAKVEALPRSHYTLDDSRKIIAYANAETGAAATAAASKSTLGAKRKWHEKFRESKRAAQ